MSRQAVRTLVSASRARVVPSLARPLAALLPRPTPGASSSSSHLVSRRASTSPSLSSPAPHLPPLPSVPKISVTPPSLSAIKEEGFLDEDVALIPESEANIRITPEAARHLAAVRSREPEGSPLALRVGVDSGGCHGFQYIMELTEQRGVDDYVMQVEGLDALPVVVDLMSLGMLKGATLHYATELIGSSFRLQDNPQAKEGGNCGCGVSWEAKEMPAK